MASNLTEFLVDLSRDPQLLESFRSDPTATMEQAGLSESDQAVLLSRDAETIRQAVDMQHEGADDLDFDAFASFA